MGGKGRVKPGPPHDKRLDKKASSTKMPRTVKQMNAQHKRMTGGGRK